jgi:formylglycine-generating enzyme required for sulfatase activity
LPTEAQWEYCCRAGTTTIYSFGDDSSDLGTYAWYYSNSGSTTHDVGAKSANPWGLYDMHGNVWEWCRDWYEPSYYSSSPSTDPINAIPGARRVLRDGGWNSVAWVCRSALRGYGYPDDALHFYGFRLALGLK